MTGTELALVRELLRTSHNIWDMVVNDWGQGRLGQTQDQIERELADALQRVEMQLESHNTEGRGVMASLTTKEMLAIAVLQGEEASIEALIDILLEQRKEGVKVIKPIKEVIQQDNIRVAIFYADGCTPEQDGIRNTEEAVKRWVKGEQVTLGMTGIERIEVYALPIVHPVKEEIIDDNKRRPNRPEPSACYRG